MPLRNRIFQASRSAEDLRERTEELAKISVEMEECKHLLRWERARF